MRLRIFSRIEIMLLSVYTHPGGITMEEKELSQIKKLGFGLMRLPKNADGSIDVDQTSKMVDMFLEAGCRYFDTAYVYDMGESEKAIKKALVDRYPRQDYFLATKLNAWMQCTDEESAKKQFYTSLERTGAGYFDFYLLHALQGENFTKYDEYHIWEFVKDLKEQGLVKHYGFSFHAGPDLLDKLLTEHPDVDFIQLQVNYADMDNPDVQSRANMEVARKHNKPFVVMEPVKGGSLANPVPEAMDVFRDFDPDASAASWAIRFAASQEGVLTVLSGMSNIEQMADNLSYMKDFEPLSPAEMYAVERVRKIIGASKAIPCTACRYCEEGCPMQIPIPEIFSAYNLYLRDGRPLDEVRTEYGLVTTGTGVASACISCGQCESACPQQIGIIGLIAECADKLEV